MDEATNRALAANALLRLALSSPPPEPQDDECPCCLGDPDLVCDACGQHSCWAGIYMCGDAVTAGVVKRSEYREAQRACKRKEKPL